MLRGERRGTKECDASVSGAELRQSEHLFFLVAARRVIDTVGKNKLGGREEVNEEAAVAPCLLVPRSRDGRLLAVLISKHLVRSGYYIVTARLPCLGKWKRKPSPLVFKKLLSRCS